MHSQTNATLQSLIQAWDGDAVVTRYDPLTNSWIFIALHSHRLGPSVGGTRLKSYPSPAAGLEDAMRLARGMTFKWAAIDLGAGGGKGVIAVPQSISGEAREGLIRRYAELVDSLQGAFATGRDLGTTDEDMLQMARITSHVHGVEPGGKQVEDPGPYTARGVLAAQRATLMRLFGSNGFAGRRILLQGLGAVGRPLARTLAKEGAELLFSDVDEQAVSALAQELGAVVVDNDRLFETECDLYAPCAVGGTLSSDTIPLLRARGVAGSANNQLATDADAEELHRRGILYAPDYIANGGGALAFGLKHRGVSDLQEIYKQLDGIEAKLTGLFEEAGERGESPAQVSRERVEARLASVS